MNQTIATLVGGLISIMIMINGTLATHTGNYSSVVIIHIVGLITIVGVLLLTKSKVALSKGIPLYLYSAGAIGIFTVLFNNLGFANLGVSLTLALGLLGQSITSVVVDHYGLLGMEVRPFEKKKLLGLGFILLGIICMSFA